MASCWQALAKRPGIDLHVLHTRQLFKRQNPFDLAPLLDGVSNQEFSKDMPHVEEWLLEQVAALKPDVMVVCGWIFWPYTRVMASPRFENAAMILGMDSPWRGSAVQRLSRWRLRSVVRHSDMVVTAGRAQRRIRAAHGRRGRSDSQRLLRLRLRSVQSGRRSSARRAAKGGRGSFCSSAATCRRRICRR